MPFFKKKFENSLSLKIKKFITDEFIFKSLGVKNFSRYLQAVQDVPFDLNIEKKYNILPVIENESVQFIKFELYYSKKFTDLLNKDLRQLNHNKKAYVLYLSSTASYFFSDPLKDEIKIIKELIMKLTKDKEIVDNFTFLIKFHPKDNIDKKEAIRKALNKINVDFIELSKNTAYPVEVLFDLLKIEIVFGYGSSSQLYAEVINSKVKNYNLYYNLMESYRVKRDKNIYPEKSWKSWITIFFSIFQKKPLKFD